MKIFEKWAIDFIRPITPLMRLSHEKYIITVMEYLTRWVEAAPAKDSIAGRAARFIFENIISRFRCLKSLTRNQGTHFINETIEALLKNFMIQHNKSSPYHPHANKTVEEFNKILEKGLTKFISAKRDDWDERIPTTLLAYRTIMKRPHKQTLFQLVYGKEAVVPT